MATTNKILNQPANNSSNWDTPLNSNFAIIDSALGSATSISVSGVGTGATALTSAQYQCMSFKFSGTLSNSVNYQLPSGVGGLFVVQNSTTGAYDLVISSAGGGTSATVVQGTTRIVYCDGTNVIFSDSSAGGTFTAGSDTQIMVRPPDLRPMRSSPPLGRSYAFAAATPAFIASAGKFMGSRPLRNWLAAYFWPIFDVKNE